MTRYQSIGLGMVIACLIFGTIWAVLGNPFLLPEKWKLAPVRVSQANRRYWVAECPRYSQLKAGKYFELPTAQEATLSGYRPALGDCPKDAQAQRIELEIRLFGKMAPNSTTLERFRQNQSQKAMEDKQDEIQDQQDELRQKLDEIENERNY
ncbi:MAG: hypothetical protein IPI64_11050 [Chloracidobacterium sp.]|nr:hypothetical protein [Chloracidobacterium sp.]